jgi:hypothetical protein
MEREEMEAWIALLFLKLLFPIKILRIFNIKKNIINGNNLILIKKSISTNKKLLMIMNSHYKIFKPHLK